MTDQDKLEMHSPNLVDNNTLKIAELFPHCVTEAKDDNGNLKYAVDFDLLRQELSQSLVEGGQERYRLDWPGKRQAILEANNPIAKTLRPVREESVNFDTTENLFIEGDNLEALKLLQESYLGQVKMIYIDPPYNTGKDFIYEDDFAEDTSDFLQRSEQVDEDGNRLVTNTESNGRFHSDWLTMMYSRLKLARNLLKDDGVIFISINDIEVHNLRKVCDEVFGSDNFSGLLTWKSRVKPVNIGEAKYRPQKEVDYVLIYHKTYCPDTFFPILSGKSRSYPYQINNRRYRLATILKSNRGSNLRESMVFEAEGYMPPEGQRWQAGESEIKRLFREGYIELKNGTPFRRYFEDEENDEHIPFYCYMPQELSSTSEKGKHILNELVGPNHGFDTVKPTELIKTLIKSSTQPNTNDIILDFFVGSGTTCQSLIELNSEDNGNRKFIIVQAREPADKKRTNLYSYVNELTKIRIDKVINNFTSENLGYRYFKIDSTNMKEVYYTPDEYNQDLLENLESHIKEDRTSEDLLFQVMLDWGVPLSLPIEVKEINGHLVYYVGYNSLVACFDTLTTELVNEIAKDEPLKFVTSERAISHDQDKTNIKARFAQLSPETDVKFI